MQAPASSGRNGHEGAERCNRVLAQSVAHALRRRMADINRLDALRGIADDGVASHGEAPLRPPSLSTCRSSSSQRCTSHWSRRSCQRARRCWAAAFVGENGLPTTAFAARFRKAREHVLPLEYAGPRTAARPSVGPPGPLGSAIARARTTEPARRQLPPRGLNSSPHPASSVLAGGAGT